MKKVLSVLALMTLATILVAPVMVSAQTMPNEYNGCKMRGNFNNASWNAKGFINCPGSGNICNFASGTSTCASCCLIDTIYTITNWIFIGVVFIAMIMLLIGAYNIITAGGDPGKVTTGRNFIMWAAVGGIIAGLSRLIPNIAISILGVG